MHAGGNAAAVGPTPFQPLYDFAFIHRHFIRLPALSNTIDFARLNTRGSGLNDEYLVTGGTLTVTASGTAGDTGTHPLYREDPALNRFLAANSNTTILCFPDYPA